MKTLADLKVGDAVWTVQTGIDFVKSKAELIILEGGESYYPNGCYRLKDMFPSLYLINPFEKKAESKLMLVSTGTSDWIEKQIIIDSITNRVFVMSEWEFYKEIEPKETLTALAIAEISLEQIAEKFGVDVEQIRIKS